MSNAYIGITDTNGLTEYKQARFSSFSKELRELAGQMLLLRGLHGVYRQIPDSRLLRLLEKTCFVTYAHPKYTKPQKNRKDAKWICNLCETFDVAPFAYRYCKAPLEEIQAATNGAVSPK